VLRTLALALVDSLPSAHREPAEIRHFTNLALKAAQAA
jgi:hypothetical protein